MFRIKRNQVIITALVVMIAAAGYLNYIDTNPRTPDEVVILDEYGEIGALVPNEGLTQVDAITSEFDGSIAIDNEVGIAVSDDKLLDSDGSETIKVTEVLEPGTAVFVNSSSDSSYFIQAKLDREQAIAKQKEILVGLINNPNLEQAKKAESADAMLNIQQRIEKESAAEALIESKGFSEVYVRIDEDTVDVVVNKEVLSEAEIAQIEDIVKRKTGMNPENIRISPIKK